ncbi:MAG: hypothetical protein H7235_11830, partial [Bdellovibrionaceae bacterium]|nr:hypothetical protein [Pseudobdellovibrionaceae bacterium]
QLRLSKETTKENSDDQPSVYGHAATSLGLKWRFFDDSGLKLAVYPGYQFDDASAIEGEDSDGRSISVPLILSKNIGLYTIVANVGESRNLDHSNKWEIFSKLALGRSISETLRIMTEVVSTNTEEGQRLDMKLGFIKEIFPNEASQYETGIFGSVGHNVGWTEDNKEHLSVLVGLAVARKPRE